MDLIRFVGTTDTMRVDLSASNNHVTINSVVIPTDEELALGFEIVNEHNGIVQGDYSAYKYIFRKEPNYVILTADPTDVYVAPTYITINYVSADENGVVTLESEKIQNNADKVVVKGCSAYPNYGYQLVNWTNSAGDEVSTEQKFVPIVNAKSVDETYTAHFELIPVPEKTLEEVKAIKDQDIDNAYAAALAEGTTATLIDGSEIKFSINQDFINDAIAAFNLASSLYDTDGISIPFEINKVCYQYAPIEVIHIYIAMQMYIVAMKSIRNELFGTIDRATDKATVEAITFSVDSMDEEGKAGYQESIASGENMIKVMKAKFGISDTEPISEEKIE